MSGHGFFGWLGDRTGIHSLRPLAVPAATIAGGLIAGPLGMGLGAGLAKTGVNLSQGDSLGHALGQGALNGALAYGAGSLFGGGSPSAVDDPDAALRNLPVGYTPSAAAVQGPGSAALNFASSAPMSDVGRSVMQRLGYLGDLGKSVGNGIGAAGNYLNNNQGTISALGNIGGGILKANAENAANRVAQENADANRDYIQFQIDRQKKIAAAFAAMYGYQIPTR